MKISFLLFLIPFCALAQIPDSGTASWYGQECAGKPMANCKPFNPNNLTAASWFYNLGTVVKVTNLNNGKYVICEITDHGPAKRLVLKGRIIDLSKKSFENIGNTNKGILRIKIEKTK